jgi:uncharacterized protein (DUF4415 family)
MSKRYETPLSLEQLAALPDDQIDTSDIPELDETFWKNAKIREPEATQQVTLRVKKSVLDTYKATGKGYQTRMNAVLESYAKTLKT